MKTFRIPTAETQNGNKRPNSPRNFIMSRVLMWVKLWESTDWVNSTDA